LLPVNSDSNCKADVVEIDTDFPVTGFGIDYRVCMCVSWPLVISVDAENARAATESGMSVLHACVRYSDILPRRTQLCSGVRERT